MFSCQFYEKLVSVRERNIKLLLESVTYLAITETATCRMDYIQKLSLAETVPVRDSFSYNKEMQPMSKYQVYGRIALELHV